RAMLIASPASREGARRDPRGRGGRSIRSGSTMSLVAGAERLQQKGGRGALGRRCATTLQSSVAASAALSLLELSRVEPRDAAEDGRAVERPSASTSTCGE